MLRSSRRLSSPTNRTCLATLSNAPRLYLCAVSRCDPRERGRRPPRRLSANRARFHQRVRPFGTSRHHRESGSHRHVHGFFKLFPLVGAHDDLVVCLLARRLLLLYSFAITCTPRPTRPDDARHHAFPSGAMPLKGTMTRGDQRSLVLEKLRTVDWCAFPISGPTLSHPTFIPVTMSDGASQETMRRRRRRTSKKTTEPDTAVKENIHIYSYFIGSSPRGFSESMLYYNTLLNFKTQKAKHMTNVEQKPRVPATRQAKERRGGRL